MASGAEGGGAAGAGAAGDTAAARVGGVGAMESHASALNWSEPEVRVAELKYPCPAPAALHARVSGAKSAGTVAPTTIVYVSFDCAGSGRFNASAVPVPVPVQPGMT